LSRILRLLACACCWACGTTGNGPTPPATGGQPVDTAGSPGDGTPPVPEGGAGGAGGAGGEAGADAGRGGELPSGGAGVSGTGGSDRPPDPPIVTGLEQTDPYPEAVHPAENPYSPAKALLGKILFWDEQLSGRDTHACGTCHRPGAGGADPRAALGASLGAGPNGIFGDADDARGSPGVARCDAKGAAKSDPIYALNVQVTPRKAPSAMDAWFFERLFWDGRATGSFVDPISGEVAIATGGALESQAAAPPLSDVEMACEGHTWLAIQTKLTTAQPLKLATQIPATIASALAEHPSYPELFQWVYGTPEVTARRILFAIATYERSLRSDQTPWDRFNAGDAEALTADQQAGLALFNVKARCATCHAPPLFTDKKFHNIGARAPALDPGLSAISSDPMDLGKMKTPSLRNVGLRAAIAGGLLHYGADNGATVRSVLGIYRQGGVELENIDPEIHTLNLPDFEFEQLLEFVQNGLTDPRAAAELPPFDRPRLRSEQ
jgi:cytochrome c peroxidase